LSLSFLSSFHSFLPFLLLYSLLSTHHLTYRLLPLCSVAGTAVSVGCKIETEDPRAVLKKISEGKINVPNA
jgi:hypothetical protein